MGRPKEYDRDKIADDLVDWAKRPDSINLCKFCATYEVMLPPSYITVWAKESTYFSQAYEFAKTCIGARREEMLNAELMHVKAYDLNAKTYDYFLRDQLVTESDQDTEKKKRLMEHEQKLKSENNQNVSDEVIKRFEDFAGIVSRAQSERKIANSNTNADEKS